MQILGFDIETYKDPFVCVCKISNAATKECIDKIRVGDDGTGVTREHMAVIEHYFDQADYIVSFNGKRFD